jgi:hypothetical protein
MLFFIPLSSVSWYRDNNILSLDNSILAIPYNAHLILQGHTILMKIHKNFTDIRQIKISNLFRWYNLLLSRKYCSVNRIHKTCNSAGRDLGHVSCTCICMDNVCVGWGGGWTSPFGKVTPVPSDSWSPCTILFYISLTSVPYSYIYYVISPTSSFVYQWGNDKKNEQS